MTDPNDVKSGQFAIEIYQQRYETYRHLDGLRWHMMQIGVAAASIVFAFSNDSSSEPGWWSWVGVGVVLIFSSVAMLKIGSGIAANAAVLKEAGEKLGDVGLPGTSVKRNSVAFWIAVVMLMTGVASIFFPVLERICN